MSNVKVTTLGNGLRVAVDAMPEVESASLGIWVACGTRHETAELNGMAHMLEHMAFKGTRTRSDTKSGRISFQGCGRWCCSDNWMTTSTSGCGFRIRWR